MAGPPTRLNARHYLVAVLVATGKTNIEIGRVVGMHPNRISIIRQSPLFQALLQQTLREIRDRSITDVLERLQREAGPTLDVLLAFRGRAEDVATRTVEDKKLSLAAARELFSRQVPVETKSTEERRTIHVQIGADQFRQMFQAMKEDGGVPALVGEVEPTAPALTLDQAIEAAAMAEVEAL